MLRKEEKSRNEREEFCVEDFVQEVHAYTKSFICQAGYLLPPEN